MKIYNLLIFSVISFSGLSQHKTIDFNNAAGDVLSSGGLFMQDYPNALGYEIPKGSGLSISYGARPWFAALDSSGGLFSSSGLIYSNLGEYLAPGPIAESWAYQSTAYLSQYNQSIWKVEQQEIDNHILNYMQSGYIIPMAILNWPAHGDFTYGISQNLAPFVDLNANGVYEPLQGEYPEIKGDQAIYAIMNDENSTYENSYNSLGIEIHLMVYQYTDGGILDDMTFINYKVINRSTRDYFNYRQSIYFDMDIGYSQDDYLGCDTTLNLGYTYNGDNYDDDSGSGVSYVTPPAAGIVSLSHEMKGFMYFVSGGGYPYTQPDNDLGAWNCMNGKWQNGSAIYDTGSGFTGVNPTSYTFTGNPNDSTEWSEYTESIFPGDRRFLMTISEDAFPVGATICSDYAVVFAGSGISNLDNVNVLLNITNSLQNLYDLSNGQFACQSSQFNSIDNIEKIEFEMYPNPTSGSFNINWSSKAPIDVVINDMTGRTVFREFNLSGGETLITVDLPSGIYTVNVISDDGILTEKLIVE